MNHTCRNTSRLWCSSPEGLLRYQWTLERVEWTMRQHSSVCQRTAPQSNYHTSSYCEGAWSTGKCPDSALKQIGTAWLIKSHYYVRPVAGIACYGLDGPGIEPRRGEFPDSYRQGPRPSRLLHNGYCISFQGIKRTGRDVDDPPLLYTLLCFHARLHLKLKGGGGCLHQ